MDKSDDLLPTSELVSLSVELASAYVSNNSVPAAELPKLLSDIHGMLRGMNSEPAPPAPQEIKLVPAVSVKKSITPDFIICLEDGKSFKSLKRHIKTKYNLTPQEYRAKWNLPSDYPMVAPNYAEARSTLAKSIGLGQIRSAKAASPKDPTTTKVLSAPPQDAMGESPTKRRGGRPPKAAPVAPDLPRDVGKKSAATSAPKTVKQTNGAKAKRTPRKASAS